jgi:hypothetical protein
MKTTMKLISLLFLVALLAAGCGGGGGSSSAPTPQLTPGGAGLPIDQAPGTTAPANFASTVAVNDANQVIGFVETTPGAPFTAALWTVSTTGAATVTPAALKPIGTNTSSAAFAIDAAGNAVGQSANGAQVVAVRWEFGVAEPQPLPAADAGNSAAFGISAEGDLIVGEAQIGAVTRAVIWVANAQGQFTSAPVVLPVDIFTVGLAASPFSSANSVARAGADILVAGEVEDGAGVKHAVLWNSVGAAFAANDLLAVGEVGSVALDVNIDGEIVGEVETATNVFSAAMWKFEDNTGTVVITPTVLSANATAAAINDTGRVVGTAAGKAAAWNTVPAQPVMTTLHATPSQAYGNNNGDATGFLVVGVNNGKGFVMKATN